MMRRVDRDAPLTGYQLAVLSTLWGSDHKHVRDMGGHLSSLTRALRVMEQRGLVSRNLHDQWYLLPAGRARVEAHMLAHYDGSS
ncbi:MAG: MarR family winged helix-turn-helix transcriptional regulator [Chloroflexi bacterium]|nr:MarR family winged helix-turn-helix transcriptional regulator [Chloroflexota bacterium]